MLRQRFASALRNLAEAIDPVRDDSARVAAAISEQIDELGEHLAAVGLGGLASRLDLIDHGVNQLTLLASGIRARVVRPVPFDT
jgi:hypothetical protein